MNTENLAVLLADGVDVEVAGGLLLKGWSFGIVPGVTLVCDDEGNYKSDLLRLLAGELPYSSGNLSLLGVLHGADAEAYRAQVFRVDAAKAEYDQVVADDFFSLQAGRYASFDATYLAELIEGLALDEHRHKQIFMLSAGTRRKVWIAAALASGAPLTLLDEPFAALDKTSVLFVRSQLRALAQTGKRALVLGDYLPPPDVPLVARIDLGR